MKLNKEQKNNLLKKLRNVFKTDVGNEENPTKFHNDIELGPGGNTAYIGIDEVLRKKIRTILENEMIDEFYPASFSFDEFKNIKSYSGKLKYAENNLKKLKSGSARTVYVVDDEKVLKVAKNKKGLEQNSVEADRYLQNYDIVAKVFETDDNDYWVEMELAKPVNKSRFAQLTGMSIGTIETYFDNISKIKRWTQSNSSTLKPTEKYFNYTKHKIKLIEESYGENKFFQDLIQMINEYDMAPGDYGRLSSYGEVIRDGKPTIVVVDFGLTYSVWDNYYSVN